MILKKTQQLFIFQCNFRIFSKRHTICLWQFFDYDTLYFSLVPNIRHKLSLIFKTQPTLNSGLEFVGIFRTWRFRFLKYFSLWFLKPCVFYFCVSHCNSIPTRRLINKKIEDTFFLHFKIKGYKYIGYLKEQTAFEYFFVCIVLIMKMHTFSENLLTYEIHV